MKKAVKILAALLLISWIGMGLAGSRAEERTPAQKRILMQRGEKVTGERLKLVKRVIESYQGCQVLSEGNELKGLIINGKEYSSFTLVIREKKKTIIVATDDGVVSFDY